MNYEKNRAPTPRALAQLEQLASDNHHFELARIFRDALGNEVGFGMADRQPLSAEERDLKRAVPEPSSITLLASVVAGLILVLRRKMATPPDAFNNLLTAKRKEFAVPTVLCPSKSK